MNDKQTGGPAFPCDANVAHAWAVFENSKKPLSDEQYANLINELRAGMTLRQYAAIKLKVPDSGTDWLDEMIRKSLRDDMAEKAMQALIETPKTLCGGVDLGETDFAQMAYIQADAMLKARQSHQTAPNKEK